MTRKTKLPQYWSECSPSFVAEQLGITEKELIKALGITEEMLAKDQSLTSEAQQRFGEALVILRATEDWAGSLKASWHWYCTYPIAPLGHLTAQQIVATGKADDVNAYLLHIANGGFA